MSSLHPASQDDWAEIIEQSCYTVEAVADKAKIPYRVLLSYIKPPDKAKVPKYKNFKKMVKTMSSIFNEKKLEYHQSFGWAYPQQIERLKEIGFGLERDQILKQIAQQTKLRGKKPKKR